MKPAVWLFLLLGIALASVGFYQTVQERSEVERLRAQLARCRCPEPGS